MPPCLLWIKDQEVTSSSPRGPRPAQPGFPLPFYSCLWSMTDTLTHVLLAEALGGDDGCCHLVDHDASQQGEPQGKHTGCPGSVPRLLPILLPSDDQCRILPRAT